MMSARERVLAVLGSTSSGMSFDEIKAGAGFVDQVLTLERLLKNLKRNHEIFAVDGKWFHKKHAREKQTGNSVRKKAGKAGLSEKRRFEIKSLDLKIQVLEQLAEITETSISNVLEEIRADLIRVGNLH